MDIQSTTDMIGSENVIFTFDTRFLKVIQDMTNAVGQLESPTSSLSSKNECNNIDANGLLHDVINYGNEWMIRHLIELGVNVDNKVNGVTPLMIAFEKGNRELVEILLEATADINIIKHVKLQNFLQIVPEMPCYQAHCSMNIILNIVSHKLSVLENVTDEMIESGSSVFEGSLLGNVKMVKYMLKQGLDVNYKDQHFRTALHNSVLLDNLKMIELLLDNGADIDALDNGGRTPIFCGVHYGRYNAVEILLQRGSNPNTIILELPLLLWSILGVDYSIDKIMTKPEEKTHLAKNMNQCIELLLQHGADVEMQNSRLSIFQVVRHFDQKCKKSCTEVVESIGSVNLAIAHLVMLKMLGKPILKRTRKGINSDLRYKKYYQLCRRVLKVEMFKSTTLFELLTESDDKIGIYLRNRKFVTKLLRVSYKHDLAIVYPYYFNTLKKRISRITREMRLKYFAAKAISDMCSYNVSHVVAEKIVGYLDQQSLEKLAASAEVDKLLKRNTPVKKM